MATKKKKKAKRASTRRGQWKKNGKGTAYSSYYAYDAKGDRHMVLLAVLKNGKIKNLKVESPAMLKAAGWVRIKGKGI